MIGEPIDVGDLVVLRTLPDDRIGLVVSVFYERSDDVTFEQEADVPVVFAEPNGVLA